MLHRINCGFKLFCLTYGLNKRTRDVLISRDSSSVLHAQTRNSIFLISLLDAKKRISLIFFSKLLNYFSNSVSRLSSVSLPPSSCLCLEIGAMRLVGPCRNKRCEAGLGEGVAVFYEPLKFYSSLHRGSLRPRGHHALNKLIIPPPPPSFPNICTTTPQTLPPTDLMDCLLFDVRVRLHHFFPSLALSLCFLPSTCVQWRGGWSDVACLACLYYVLIHFACESMRVLAVHT